MEDQEVHLEQPPLPPQPENGRLCRYCRQNIHTVAKVCQHCSCYQNSLIQGLRSYALLIPALVVLVGILQWCTIRQERTTASESVKNATIATDKATIAADEAKKRSMQFDSP
jgi:hypothetical protein